MKHPDNLKKIIKIGAISMLLIFVFVIAAVVFVRSYNRSGGGESLKSLIAEAQTEKDSVELYATSHKEEPEKNAEISEPEEELYATSHKEETEEIQTPLTNEPVRLSDIYAVEDTDTAFISYYPDAIQYAWEVYDITENQWKEAASDMVLMEYDELYRNVSVFRISESCHHNNELIVRCTIDFKEKESITDIATLHILKKDIADLLIEDFKTDSGYISARTVPVTVKYLDGSQETLTGLDCVHFLNKQESSEQSTTISGNSMETITTVITTCDYFYLSSEETDVVMRCQINERKKDIPVKITGEDLEAPVITKLDISDFTISREDIPVTVTVTIHAEDNSTPYPQLMYAFLPEGHDVEEAEEDDWHTTPAFEIDITQNGKWFAYCKDQCGNIASEERNIIVVDNKAPVVSLSLESESWCITNKILVSAKDGLSVEYCYNCLETGENSGWINQSEYEVRQNSTWNVKVRDAAGNVTEQDITIDNIDNEMPVIKNITEKETKKGEIIINEKEN